MNFASDQDLLTLQELRDLTYISSLLPRRRDLLIFVDTWLVLHNADPRTLLVEYTLLRNQHLLAQARKAVEWYLAVEADATALSHQADSKADGPTAGSPYVDLLDDGLDSDEMPF